MTESNVDRFVSEAEECVRQAEIAISIETAERLEYPEKASAEDIARFRKQAEECLQQAERAISPLDQESWLRLAAAWIRLAQDLERRQQGGT